jgi:hypothetical protein
MKLYQQEQEAKAIQAAKEEHATDHSSGGILGTQYDAETSLAEKKMYEGELARKRENYEAKLIEQRKHFAQKLEHTNVLLEKAIAGELEAFATPDDLAAMSTADKELFRRAKVQELRTQQVLDRQERLLATQERLQIEKDELERERRQVIMTLRQVG